MKATETNVLDWQKRYGTEEACAQALAQQRWPEGFRCPRCGHDHGYVISTRHSCECSQCYYQASLTAGTLFHSTNLPLTKWFWAIYLTASDKGGISAARLSKQIAVSWITASRMLRKIRIAMGHRAASIGCMTSSRSMMRWWVVGAVESAGVAPRGNPQCWWRLRIGTPVPDLSPCNRFPP